MATIDYRRARTAWTSDQRETDVCDQHRRIRKARTAGRCQSDVQATRRESTWMRHYGKYQFERVLLNSRCGTAEAKYSETSDKPRLTSVLSMSLSNGESPTTEIQVKRPGALAKPFGTTFDRNTPETVVTTKSLQDTRPVCGRMKETYRSNSDSETTEKFPDIQDIIRRCSKELTVMRQDTLQRCAANDFSEVYLIPKAPEPRPLIIPQLITPPCHVDRSYKPVTVPSYQDTRKNCLQVSSNNNLLTVPKLKRGNSKGKFNNITLHPPFRNTPINGGHAEVLSDKVGEENSQTAPGLQTSRTTLMLSENNQYTQPDNEEFKSVSSRTASNIRLGRTVKQKNNCQKGTDPVPAWHDSNDKDSVTSVASSCPSRDRDAEVDDCCPVAPHVTVGVDVPLTPVADCVNPSTTPVTVGVDSAFTSAKVAINPSVTLTPPVEGEVDFSVTQKTIAGRNPHPTQTQSEDRVQITQNLTDDNNLSKNLDTKRVDGPHLSAHLSEQYSRPNTNRKESVPTAIPKLPTYLYPLYENKSKLRAVQMWVESSPFTHHKHITLV